MAIQIGDTLPHVTFMEMTADGPTQRSTVDIFAGKTVALFAVPGAFTPTCSVNHLPGFRDKAEDLKAKGVDEIVCTSVNDVFVMDAWGRAKQVGEKMRMLADGNGEFATALGLQLDGAAFGMGERSQRYAMLVSDGVVTQLNVDPAGSFEVSSVDYLLAQI